jgi:DNA-binding transcriptional ArsR family regulator
MVNSRSQQLDETFFALSDPTRRAIIARLADGDSSVAELSEPFQISAPAISKHLRVLERAGLLTQQREGRGRRCQLLAEPLQEAAEWVEEYRQFWEGQLDRLAEYLEKNGEE